MAVDRILLMTHLVFLTLSTTNKIERKEDKEKTQNRAQTYKINCGKIKEKKNNNHSEYIEIHIEVKCFRNISIFCSFFPGDFF